MFSAIADVLSLIVQPCYDLTGNWWLAILLFTIITKIILIPMSLWVQKNSIVMVQIMPALNRLKVQYFGDRETIGEKQNEMYKEKGYHPLLSLIPLAVQIIILFGLVDVIHSITDHGAPGTEFLGLVPINDGGLSWIMPLLAGLSAVAMGFAQNRINPLQREQSRAEKNMTNGLSIGLSLVLGVFVAAGMAFYWIVSNLSAIVIQLLMNVLMPPEKHIDYDDLAASRVELDELDKLASNKKKWWQKNPLGKREKADYKRFFNIVDKHIVFYSEGSGFYKYFKGPIEYLLAHSDAPIHYVTNDPDDCIFELAKTEPRLHPYYISEQRAITLMMKMDADIVVTTQEDLDNYYIKRSYVRSDVEYVFTFHHMTSTHLTAMKHSYDHYDTLLCVGPHQVKELRRGEQLYKLPEKNLVECGYHLLDENIASYARLVEKQRAGADAGAKAAADAKVADDAEAAAHADAETAADAKVADDAAAAADAKAGAAADADAGAAADTGGPSPANDKPVVLVAPSWQENNLLDLCFDDLMKSLLGRGWRVIVRPHPEYTKRYRPRWEALQNRYADVPEDELYFERDFSSNDTVFTSDLIITDWSSVFCEFSFSTGKPTVFIDTPMKVGNPDYQELGIEPTDISLRNEVGASFDPADLSKLGDTVADMIANAGAWHDRIIAVREKTIFNVGRGGEIAGEYLLERMLAKQEERAQKNAE